MSDGFAPDCFRKAIVTTHKENITPEKYNLQGLPVKVDDVPESLQVLQLHLQHMHNT